MDEKTKRLAFSIVEWIDSMKESNTTFSSEEQESLDVALQCLQDVFKIDVTDDAQQKLFSTKPSSLMSIFEVYLRTKSAVDQKKAAKSNSTQEISPEKLKKADDFKAQGNKLVAEKKFEEAIEKYTQAIELNPNSAVYYSNRAAAYSQQNNHDQAIEDALKAAELDPDFSKAYSRLGHAYYATGRFQEAHDAYEKGLELDPDNKTMKQAYLQAKKKLPVVTDADAELAEEAGTDRGMPAGMPDLGGLGGMLNNPNFLSMAQQMMAQNPGLAQMAQQMMGGQGRGAGGAAPDLSSLLNNPALMNMAQQAMSDPNVMNNLSGLMGGAGRGRGSRGSRN